jgi:hypothetical protein
MTNHSPPDGTVSRWIAGRTGLHSFLLDGDRLGEFRIWPREGGTVPKQFSHETIMAGSIARGLAAGKKLLPIG